MSWLGSILFLGGIVGNFLYAALNNYFGRKISVLTLGIPAIVSCMHSLYVEFFLINTNDLKICWIIVIAAPQIEYLYAARFLAGITGGGLFVCVPLFISEVASDQ